MKRYVKSQIEFDSQYFETYNRHRYSIKLKNIEDPDFLVAQIIRLSPYDDADYAWAQLKYGVLRFIRNGKVLERKYVDPFDLDVEDEENYINRIVNQILHDLEKIDESTESIMVHNSTNIEKDVEGGTSSTSVHINPELQSIDGLIDDLHEIESHVAPHLLEPDEDDRVELKDEQDYIEAYQDDVIITVTDNSRWYFDNLDETEFREDDEDEYFSEGTDGYTVLLDTSKGVVRKLKEILTPEIPATEGKYRASFAVMLCYDIENVFKDRQSYEDEDVEIYADNAKIFYNRSDSYIEYINIKDFESEE